MPKPTNELGCDEALALPEQVAFTILQNDCPAIPAYLVRESIFDKPQVRVFESADGLRRAFACDPPPQVNFSKQRLILYSDSTDTAQSLGILAVRKNDKEVAILAHITTTCSGQALGEARYNTLVAIPRGSEKVIVARCEPEAHCDPTIP